MSSVVQLVIGSLLLSAGLISVIAAILGNPIRVGRAAIPGPNGGPARAVVAGIGTASLAACALVFILGPTETPTTAGTGYQPPPTTPPPAAQGDTGSSSGSIGGLPALTPTPTPTGSPKPPAAPSSAPPVPGKPTVTLIKVTGDTTAGCDQTYRASVNVANGPVTLTYVISVDGNVRGPNPRTATVTGSTAVLDTLTVDLRNPGEIAYNVLTPNTVSDTKTWTVPSACQKAVSLGKPRVVGGPHSSDNCSATPLQFAATLNVSPSPGFNVTYHVVINGVAGPDRTEFFPGGAASITGSVTLADNPAGYSVDVGVVVTSPVSASNSATLTGACTSPAPPVPTDDPSTSVAAPTSDLVSEPAELTMVNFAS